MVPVVFITAVRYHTYQCIPPEALVIVGRQGQVFVFSPVPYSEMFYSVRVYWTSSIGYNALDRPEVSHITKTLKQFKEDSVGQDLVLSRELKFLWPMFQSVKLFDWVVEEHWHPNVLEKSRMMTYSSTLSSFQTNPCNFH